MKYIMINEVWELGEWNIESEAFSIYQAMTTLTDRRKGKFSFKDGGSENQDTTRIVSWFF